jgi:hypothetical protein
MIAERKSLIKVKEVNKEIKSHTLAGLIIRDTFNDANIYNPTGPNVNDMLSDNILTFQREGKIRYQLYSPKKKYLK